MVDEWELIRVEELKNYKEKKYVFRSLEWFTLNGYPARRVEERYALTEAEAWKMLDEG